MDGVRLELKNQTVKQLETKSKNRVNFSMINGAYTSTQY